MSSEHDHRDNGARPVGSRRPPPLGGPHAWDRWQAEALVSPGWLGGREGSGQWGMTVDHVQIEEGTKVSHLFASLFSATVEE